MADEINVQCAVTVSKGGVYFTSFPNANSFKADMEGDAASGQLQTVTSTDEQLNFGEPASVGTVGSLYVKNLSETEYIQLSWNTGGSFAANVFDTLLPGEGRFYHPKQDAVYCKAQTASANVFFIACQGTQYT